MKRQKLRNVSEKFYNKLSDNDEESGDETELFTRSKQKKSEVKFVEKVIEEGDTLQSISIKHRCTIAELKRLNNIHKENEIYARRFIKVPDRPFSAALAGVHISGSSSPQENVDSIKEKVDIEALNKKLSSNETREPEVNNIIFNSNLYAKPCDHQDVINDDVDEETNLLTQQRTMPADPVVTKLSCSGADGDIPWIALIICVVIVVFAIPIIYVVYIAEHFDEFHHNHTVSS